MKKQAADWKKTLAKYVADKGIVCRIYTEFV